MYNRLEESSLDISEEYNGKDWAWGNHNYSNYQDRSITPAGLTLMYEV